MGPHVLHRPGVCSASDLRGCRELTCVLCQITRRGEEEGWLMTQGRGEPGLMGRRRER